MAMSSPQFLSRIGVLGLLNQRRALREFGADPNQAQVRGEYTVERYQQ